MVTREIVGFIVILFLCSVCCCSKISEYDDEFNLPSTYLEIESENLEILNANIFANKYVDAKFIYDKREYEVQIRFHGNLSRHYLKKSYRVKFEDDNLFDNKKKIVLSSQWLDKSLLRSMLSFSLFENSGLLTPDRKYVALYLNNDYNGIYYLIEPIDDFFLINRNKPFGHFYKALRGKAEFTFIGGYDVRVGFKKTPVDDGDYSDLEYLISLLDNVPTDSLSYYLNRVLDIENYLRYLAVSVLVANTDGFHNNFRLYKTITERFEIIPWDLDQTFILETWTLNGSNNLSKQLLKVDIYRTYYKNYLLELLNSNFSEQAMFSEIDELSEDIIEAHKNDPFLKAKGSNLQQETQNLKDFVKIRREYIENQLQNF